MVVGGGGGHTPPTHTHGKSTLPAARRLGQICPGRPEASEGGKLSIQQKSAPSLESDVICRRGRLLTTTGQGHGRYRAKEHRRSAALQDLPDTGGETKFANRSRTRADSLSAYR